MEIEMLLDHKLKNSERIKSLQTKLEYKTNSCLQRLSSANHTPQQLDRNRKICEGDFSIYKRYLAAYKEQFSRKGEDMCLQNLESEQIKQQQRSRRSCVQFYIKSFNVFEENVVDKLQSLVYKLDFKQL